ncbi:MAG TPA: FkbM family methyltransferase [Pyrinomonadaceae bacterium]|nr:FkbM family methyltransferase [Pyrinomonadaceae bacterium]
MTVVSGLWEVLTLSAASAPRSGVEKMRYLRRGVEEFYRVIRREPKIHAGEFDLNLLPRMLGKDDPVILEIGCNDGGVTLAFLELFPRSKVFAFEPDPRAIERFNGNVKNERAKLFNIAIAGSNGLTEFYLSGGHPSPDWEASLPRGWDMSSSIRKPKQHLNLHPWCTFDEVINVQTKTLDTWCAEEDVDSIDFIWADVQGAEIDLITGGQQSLSRTRYLYTEYNNREMYEGQVKLRDILRLLPDFEVVKRFSNDILLKNTNFK